MKEARLYNLESLESRMGEGTELTRETVITDEENKLLVGDNYWGLNFPSYIVHSYIHQGEEVVLKRVTPEDHLGEPSHDFYAPGSTVLVDLLAYEEKICRVSKPASRVVSTSLLSPAEFAVVLSGYRNAVSSVVRMNEGLAEQYGLRVRALNEQMEREIAAIREKYSPKLDAIQLEDARERERTPILPSLAEIVAGAESERVP